MTSIEVNSIRICFDEESLRFTLYRKETAWEWSESYIPHFEWEGGKIEFKDADSISHERVENGLGVGIRSRYQGFSIEGSQVPYTFETYVWIEKTTEDIYFEWIPICEDGVQVKRVYWPGAMAFENNREDWYTLLNCQQGLLIPNTWETELGPLVFDGFFGTAGGYMPWFGQVKEGDTQLMVQV